MERDEERGSIAFDLDFEALFAEAPAVGEMPVVFRRNDLRPSFVQPAAVLEFLRNMFARRVGRS